MAPSGVGHSEIDRRDLEEFLSLKQLMRRYLLEQQLLFLETEAEEALRMGMRLGKDSGTVGPTVLRVGARPVGSRGGASGGIRGRMVIGTTNPSFKGGFGATVAGTRTGTIQTSNPLGKSPAALPL